jgi:hypothetical protein
MLQPGVLNAMNPQSIFIPCATRAGTCDEGIAASLSPMRAVRRLTRKLAQFQIQGVLFLIMPNAHIQTAGRSLMTAASAAMRRSGGADSSEGKEASGKGPFCMCSTVEPSLLG